MKPIFLEGKVKIERMINDDLITRKSLTSDQF